MHNIAHGRPLKACVCACSCATLSPAAISNTTLAARRVVNVKTCTASKATSEAFPDPNLTALLNKMSSSHHV